MIDFDDSDSKISFWSVNYLAQNFIYFKIQYIVREFSLHL